MWCRNSAAKVFSFTKVFLWIYTTVSGSIKLCYMKNVIIVSVRRKIWVYQLQLLTRPMLIWHKLDFLGFFALEFCHFFLEMSWNFFAKCLWTPCDQFKVLVFLWVHHCMSLDSVSKICIESFREALQNILEGLQSRAKSVGPVPSVVVEVWSNGSNKDASF